VVVALRGQLQVLLSQSHGYATEAVAVVAAHRPCLVLAPRGALVTLRGQLLVLL